LREKTFANFKVLWLFVKVFFAKFRGMILWLFVKVFFAKFRGTVLWLFVKVFFAKFRGMASFGCISDQFMKIFSVKVTRYQTTPEMLYSFDGLT